MEIRYARNKNVELSCTTWDKQLALIRYLFRGSLC